MILFILLLVRAGYPYIRLCDNSDQIDDSQWCDGSFNCIDKSDEKKLCCAAGKHRDNVTGECIDIDECSTPGPLVCSQHCHNTEGSFQCTCDHGFILRSNPTTVDDRETFCKATGEDPVFLVSVNNRILKTTDLRNFDQVSMEGIEDSHHIYDFDYDYQNGLLFWCSGDTQDLQSAMHKNLWKARYDNLQLLDASKIAEQVDCVSIAVDWVNDKVYWVTADRGQLVVSSYDGSNQITLLWRNIWSLRAVAVSPKSGYIFWSDCGTDPHIGRANMDGSHQMFLIKESEGDRIMQPTAMTIDHNNNHLYWIDAHHETLHIMDFNGDSFTLTESNVHMDSAWRMSLFEDKVYWTDSQLSSGNVYMRSASKLSGTGYQERTLPDLDMQITGFRLHHALLQPAHSNACAGNKCHHLCLLTPTGSECKCDNGYLEDKQSCLKLPSTCTVSSCDPRYCIMCGNGDCLLSSLKCDGDYDCHDGSDELNCPSTTGHHSNCIAREFQCSNNSRQCISERMVCDGHRDCSDGSDEARCSGRNQCRREDFVCDGNTCLSRDRRCNGVNDCKDRTDELNCQGPPCSTTQFTCTMSRQCIDITQRCDGTTDCPDGSDEFACPIVCRETEFSCDSGQRCVGLSSRCDETPDCEDGSDEADCDKTPLCPEGQRKCSHSTQQCIKVTLFCNGEDDCPGGTDEIGCNCQPEMIPCPGSQECIRKDQWCDTEPDCDNGADEIDNCCPHGFYRPDYGPDCIDQDECLSQDGPCSQHCNNTVGGYTCSCDEGYDLVNTTKQHGTTSTLSFCRAKGDMNIVITVAEDSPYYLTIPENTNESDDRQSYTLTGSFLSISMSGDYRKSELLMADFDFDIRNKKIFWCSTKYYRGRATYERAIWVADLGDNLESIRNSRIIVNNINCDSMAVDWINKLVYFTSDTNSIDVVDYEGVYRRAIIWTGLSAPRAIEVDPDHGLLFYTDWGGYRAHVGRANMDGSERKSLLNNTSNTSSLQIKWPNALTIDHPNKNLYWMDASDIKSIECMRYDGSLRYTITSRSKALGSPWRMRVFQDRVYWREKQGEIKSANKFTGNEFVVETVVSASGEKLADGNGLRIFHPVVQPMSTARCLPDSCSNLCLPVPNGYKCACPTGHALLKDDYSCRYQIDMFAFVAMKEMIVKTALEPLEAVLQPITFQYNKYLEGTFWSIDYHEEWVYFNTIATNISQISIKRMLFDGRESKVVVNEKSDGGMSIDWLNEKIYWASSETVSVGELDGSVHTTLLQEEGFNFRDILVDPCNGYIYLAAWNIPGGIYRVSMDGDMDSFTEVVELGPDSLPSGLTLDRDTNSLFYANKNLLYKVSLNRSPLTPVIIATRGPEVSIKSLDLWGRDKIIWTESYPYSPSPLSQDEGSRPRSRQDQNPSRIVAMPKLGNSATEQIIREDITKATFGIKVWPKRDSTCQERNPCLDNNCSHMCLQSQVGLGEDRRQKGYRCACPTGYALKANSTTECADEIVQYLVYNPASGIQTVSLDTDFLTPIKEPPNMSFRVTTFDIDAKNNLVYYCYGNPNKFEVRGLFDETGNVTVLPIHTQTCSGMSVEWITNKLYIVDYSAGQPLKGLILVVDLDRPYLRKCIAINLHSPLDIVVHPLKGKIYWILASHSIMSTNMDKTDVVETIVSYNSEPAGRVMNLDDITTQLFIDYSTDHLYWTENVEQGQVGFIGLIKRVDLSTKRVETVLEVIQTPLAGATMINSVLYYTDLQDGRLYRNDGVTNTSLLTTYPGAFLLSSQSQPPLLDNPCKVNNGGCSDLCLLDSDVGYRCSCPTGIQLLQDSMNCDTPHNKSLVVANDTRISMISLSSTEPVIDRVLTSVPRNLKSIDVDIRENKIYWSEVNLEGGAIWVLDMKSGFTEKIVYEDMVIPNSIAIDWNAQNIYWVDSSEQGKGTLEVMSLRSRKRSVLKKYEDTTKRPHQIVIDPNLRLLFVSYPVPSKEVITRMWMDGSNPFNIMTADDRGPTQIGRQVVSSLAIDLVDRRLYWSSNDNMNHISSCDYAGRERDIINGITKKDRQIKAISILNRNVFVQNLEYSPYTQVMEYQELNADHSEETKPSKTYTFNHLKGNIVSMKVSSVAVLEDARQPCKPNMCTEQICIPNDIEADCRCGDDDIFCQKESEQKVEVVPNYLPDSTSRCPEDFCNKHGSCLQYRVANNQSFGVRCECDDGYEKPRCKTKRKGIQALALAVVGAVIAVIIVTCLVAVFACRRLKLNGKSYSKELRDHSSENDDTETFQREPEAKKLNRMAVQGIGRSYLQIQTKKESVEQFV